jgi:periplasmic divalent cation tolerance protein
MFVTDKIVVLCNCSSADEAAAVARHLVDERLAACVNILPGVRSVYRWQGAVEEASEWTLLIKTRRHLFEALRHAVQKKHSYSLPELIAVPVVDGSSTYLDWIDHETLPPQ